MALALPGAPPPQFPGAWTRPCPTKPACVSVCPAAGPRAPRTHVLGDHALAHFGHHGHGCAGALSVDEEDTPQVHDQAHGPHEEQLALGNLHTAPGQDLHEACGARRRGGKGQREKEGGERERVFRACGHLPREKGDQLALGPDHQQAWTERCLPTGYWPLSLSFPPMKMRG